MRPCFLILVHKNPRQVVKLINALLRHQTSKVIIHVDLKSKDVYHELSNKYAENNRVIFVKERYRVFWGSYNQIRATYSLMRTANSLSDLDYFCLLSGQDVPIKPIKDFTDFLTANKGKEFLVNFKLPNDQWAGGGLNRLQYYSFDSQLWPYMAGKLSGVARLLQNLFKYTRPIKYSYFGGSNWFTLSKQALVYACARLQNDPAYLSTFRCTRCADEIFVQTILMNSPFEKNVTSSDLRIVDWSGPEYPKIFRIADLEQLIRSPKDKFFARKLDENLDTEIIDKLYEHIGS